MKFLNVIVFALFSINVYSIEFTSVIQKAIQVGNYSLGIGSEVYLNKQPSIFLGKALKPNGELSYKVFLNLNDKKVYYIDIRDFSEVNASEQKILDLYEQQGGTCTAYAIDDFLQQMNLSGFSGNGELNKTLSNEEGRTQLLADSINQYYLTLQHKFSINGILNGYGKKYDFKCDKLKTNSYEKARNYILNYLTRGMPVLFSFDIGPKMYNSPFELINFDQKNTKMDNRLWIPRKVGERNSGGHSIVAAGSFELSGKTYLVMIDSDWSEPRVWDMESFLNDHTALDEMEFITCK